MVSPTVKIGDKWAANISQAVVAALKATDTRQESEKRPVPVAVKAILEEEDGAAEGIKTK